MKKKWAKMDKEAFKSRLLRKQGNKCGICHQPMFEKVAGIRFEIKPVDIDHKVPKLYGGSNKTKNLQLTHRECNRAKGREDWKDFQKIKYNLPFIP
jgi:5-methylcytosine-specific restriction endonuclease McrA